MGILSSCRLQYLQFWPKLWLDACPLDFGLRVKKLFFFIILSNDITLWRVLVKCASEVCWLAKRGREKRQRENYSKCLRVIKPAWGWPGPVRLDGVNNSGDDHREQNVAGNYEWTYYFNWEEHPSTRWSSPSRQWPRTRWWRRLRQRYTEIL